MSKDIYNQMETMESSEQLELNEINYNCTECSSPIEILSINDNNIEFKCINNNHNIKISIKEYINKMKEYNNNEINNDKCKIHNNELYIFYCIDCNKHLCKECIKLREHYNHNKNYIPEIKPNKNELNHIENIIKYYDNQINKLNKEKLNKTKEITKKYKEYKNKIKEINKSNIEKIELNKIEELKMNKNKYILEIENIKNKYINEIKEKKNKFEIDNNNINNKYKLINENNNIIYKNKLENIDNKYIKIIQKYKYEKIIKI